MVLNDFADGFLMIGIMILVLFSIFMFFKWLIEKIANAGGID